MSLGALTAVGQLYTTTAAPTATSVFNGGVAMTSLGQVHTSILAPQAFVNGFGVLNNGALCIELGGELKSHAGGLPRNALGALICNNVATPNFNDPFVGGLRVAPLGPVYITEAVPTGTHSFSDGFDLGFG